LKRLYFIFQKAENKAGLPAVLEVADSQLELLEQLISLHDSKSDVFHHLRCTLR
jgi:hypothetical protein